MYGVPPLPASSRNSPLFLCFSHLRWNFVYQRPQHLMSRAAREYRVFFVEEPLIEDTGASHFRLEQQPGSITVATPILPRGLSESEIVDAQRQLVDGLVAECGPVEVSWYYTPMALEFSAHIVPDLCVYDCMDELSAFRGASPRLLANEQELFEKADLVFTGGVSIFEAKRSRHASVYAFPSSVDQAHFNKARRLDAAEPAVQADIPRPRVGFFGVIDERMDIDLVEGLARIRPDLQFVIIGPVVKIDPGTLPILPNIHWLGSQDYQALPDFISGWDVGFMPFARNEATRFISPTKTPEFLAAGVPVVSTAIADVVRPYGDHSLVAIASTPEQMSAAIDEYCQMPREPWRQRVDRYLGGMSWDVTWRDMHKLMQPDRASQVPASVPKASASAVVGQAHV